MKNNYFFIAAILTCIALFTGCSDDDGDKGNGGRADKRVARIISDFGGGDIEISEFVYDEQGRLIRVVEDYGSDGTYELLYTYAEDEVRMYGDEESVTATLIDGKAVRCVYEYGDYEYEEYRYEYEGNYLSGVSCWLNGDAVYDVELSVDGGDLYEAKDEMSRDRAVFTPSSIANNANIDLYAFILPKGLEEDVEIYYPSAITGERFAHLPSRIVTPDRGTYTYTYELDEDGNVVKIEDEDGSSYTIVYEK